MIRLLFILMLFLISCDTNNPVEQEMTTKAKQAISEKMFGDPTYYRKDGGMVGISHLTRPL